MLNDSALRRTAACGAWGKTLTDRASKIPAFDIEVVEASRMTATSIAKYGFDEPLLVKDPPSSLGMRIPPINKLDEVAAVIGEQYPIKVIEVATQTQIEGHTLGDFAKYLSNYSPTSHKILNMITLEFSSTPLSAKVETPSFVRDCDWIDSMWPLDRRSRGEYPAVQKYCLSGMAGSYTDFHVDFGGTSVWYHVLSGKKRFYLVPPTTQNLKAYANWTISSAGESQFFGDIVQAHEKSGQPQLFVLDLLPGQTLMIPGAWIHAVYTPEDALVMGGNFLTAAKIVRQLQVAQVEQMTRVGRQYRFPYFKEINFYMLCKLLPLARKGLQAAQEAKSVVGIDWEEVFEDEDDDVAGAASALIGEVVVLRQLPFLVRISELWTAGGQLATAKADAAKLAVVANISISEYNAADIKDIKSIDDIFATWWTVLDQVAKLHDEPSSTIESENIRRVQNSHQDNINFLDSSFIHGGLAGGCNSWEENSLRHALRGDVHQFSAPSSGASPTATFSKKSSPDPVAAPVIVVNTKWVQCISCEKWRTAPAHIDVDSLPDNWECGQNTWDQYNNCSVLEEDTDSKSGTNQDYTQVEGQLNHKSPKQEHQITLKQGESDSSGLKLSLSALKRSRDSGTEIKDETTKETRTNEKKRKIHLTLAPKAKKIKIIEDQTDSYAMHYDSLVTTSTEGNGRTRGKKLSRGFLEDAADVEVDDDNDATSEGIPDFEEKEGDQEGYEDVQDPGVTEEDFDFSESEEEEDLQDSDGSDYEEEASDDGLDVVHVELEEGENEAPEPEKRSKKKTKNINSVLLSSEKRDGETSARLTAPVWKIGKFSGGISATESSSNSAAGMPSLAALVGAASSSSADIKSQVKPKSPSTTVAVARKPATHQAAPVTFRSNTGAGSARPGQKQPPSRAQLMKLLSMKR